MRISKKQWLLLQAAALTVAVGAFLLIGPHLARAISVNPADTPNGMSGDGSIVNPYSIKTCQNLQDVTLNLGAHYSIDNDIDCTATSTWNAGSGFAPIGSVASPFTGNIDGHNHTIDGLYINQSTNNIGPDAHMGLFRKVNHGLLLNFEVTNATVYGISVLDQAATGGIAGEITETIISDVHFDGNIIMESCNLNEKIGGLVGIASSLTGHEPNTINASSATGSITVQDGGGCGTFQHTIGGLIGKTGAAGIGNVYASMVITVNGTQESLCLNTHCRDIGGLIGARDATLENFDIHDSYSAGSITIQNDNGSYLSYNVGGLVGTMAQNVSAHHLFSTTEINVPATCNNVVCNSNTQNVGGFAGSANGNGGTWEDYSYDYTTFNHAHCTGDTNANDGACGTVNNDGSEPDYLKGTSNVNPINAWDIVNVWNIIPNGLPLLLRYPSPNPATPDLVTATIDSGTQITVNWGESTPSNQLSKYVIMCKPTNESVWTYCADNIASNATSAQLTGLTPATSYNIAVYAIGTFGYVSNPGQIVSSTATPGFELISSCTDLQNINNDLGKNYELGHDIDCSDTINWDGGHGFLPLGALDFIHGNFGAFSGIFKGNNYSISNLYCDRSVEQYDSCGLFAYTDQNAYIQDVRLKSFHLSSGYATAGLVVAAVNTTVTNVQVTDLDITGQPSLAAGLIGALTPQILYGPGTSSVSRSSVTGTINITGGTANVGGFIGAAVTSSDTVSNNYANVDINADSATLAGGFISDLELNTDAHFTNNYAAGSLNILSNDPNLNTLPSYNTNFPDYYSLTGGFTGLFLSATPDNLQNNFAHVSLGNASPEAIIGGFAAVSGVELNLNNNYFDADFANVATCVTPLAPNVTTCTAIAGQPDYFKNNSTNPPLDQWDFTNIWAVNPSFPLFSYTSTSTITSIPPERLTPKPTTNTTGGGTTSPVASDGTGAASVTNRTGSGTSVKVTTSDEAGVLGAIKHFVRSLPVVVVVGFPYALFGLLLIAALILLAELAREMRRAHVLEVLIRKQQSLAEERDAFWHLAANYLRAPVTLIVGGAEALRDMHAIDMTSEISTLAASLQTKVADIMKKIEGSVSLQSISKIPHGLKRGTVNRRIYLIPVTIIALLVVLANYAASSFRNINPGTLGYLTQVLIFIAVATAFYWALSYLTQGKKRRQLAEEMYQRQTAELANARHDLINDTATMLASDTAQLDALLKSLPAGVAQTAPGALATLREGTDRLREIVHSFALLIKVQESNQLVTSKVDLGSILSSVRSKLTPQIASKNVRVTAPAMSLPVSAESELAQQVIESIVANAVDYSPAGGTVSVETRNLGDQVQVRISDQGQGIAKDQLAHLFQPFTRADGKSAMDMSHGGFGINLYLDKLIMEKLGGTIEAASTPGKGTAITLTWPS